MTRVRRWLRSLHRYTGLGIGAVLVLLGLSGSIITYQQELDALLHPDLWDTHSVHADRARSDRLGAS